MRRDLGLAMSIIFMLVTSCADRSERLYPLDEGRAWIYEVSAESAFGTKSKTTATVTNLPKRELEGKSVVPQRSDTGEETSFSFVGVDADGVFSLGNQGPEDPEPTILTPAVYILRRPYEQGTTWDYQFVELASPGEEPPTLHASIEGAEETVTVPAGTFSNCLKIVGKAQVQRNSYVQSKVAIEQLSWFCPDVGLVRSISKIGNGGYSLQLKSFESN